VGVNPDACILTTIVFLSVEYHIVCDVAKKTSTLTITQKARKRSSG